MAPITFEATDFDFLAGPSYPVVTAAKVGLLESTMVMCFNKAHANHETKEKAIEYAKKNKILNRHYAFVINDNRLLICDENGDILHIVCNPIIHICEGKTEWV